MFNYSGTKKIFVSAFLAHVAFATVFKLGIPVIFKFKNSEYSFNPD